MDFLLGLLSWGALWILVATVAARYGWDRTWFLGWLMAGIAFVLWCVMALMAFVLLLIGNAMPIAIVAPMIAMAFGFWLWGGAILRLRRRQEYALFVLLTSQGRSTHDLSSEQQ